MSVLHDEGISRKNEVIILPAFTDILLHRNSA